MFWFLYNLVFIPIYILLLPHFCWRMWKRGGYGRDFCQRFGVFRPEIADALKSGGRVWVHAVSVGEVGLALKLLQAWREQEPDVRFVLSVTTSTGYAVAQKRQHPDDVVIYFPLDTPWVVGRILKQVRPRAYVMIEQEFWPNMLRQCRRRGIPTALVNGRISRRSYARYLRARFASTRVLPLIDRCFVQTLQDAKRICAIGAPAVNVVVIPSIKYGTVVLPELASIDAAHSVLEETGLTRPVLVGGSLWPGEFGVVAKAGKAAGYSVVLVPRHFERSEIARQELSQLGLSARFRTEDAAEADVLVINTTGEMMAWYALADVVFVGKSLPTASAAGGQNPIEPAALGKTVLVGPRMGNFSGVMRDFKETGAIQTVEDEAALEAALLRLVDSDEAAEIGARAKAVVEANGDALHRTVDELLAILDA